MKTAAFCINAVVWLKGVLSILLPMTIVEDIVLDFNVHSKVISRLFIQMPKGTTNNMAL